MGRIEGVVVGIVRGLNDPDNLGRVELNFPWMSDDNKSHWARVATLMAGPDRGSWFQPEIDDEVLVAFEHGNVQHPYVLGFLWNKKDKPPTKQEGIDGHVRRFKSVAGHVIDFDDRAGKNAVRVTTAAKHKINLDDTASTVTIESNTGCRIELTPAGITINAGPGMMTLTCSMLNVQAPMTTFGGVVQAQTVIAQSIVGSTYTPGIGNLL